MITINVGEATDERSLHSLLKEELGFPDFYGANWDAFWDAITGLVTIPDRLRFIGWDALAERVPRGAEMLQRALTLYSAEVSSGFVAEYVSGDV
ncbi:barstar family protein [Streptomyces sp. NPDC002698]|uniref:barstar family protein n=1 Tax=Streptomyces sp. NPDC002698 TaxID=3364660 RepID=UPI0036B80D62